MRLVTDTIEFGSAELPRWNTISISGYHIREAGSTAVQELAFTIADGMAYVEAALERGLRVDDFAPRLSLLLQQPLRLLRGDRQVPGGPADLVEAHGRALPGRERAVDVDALPHPDRRRVAHPAAAAQQPDPGRASRRWPPSSAARQSLHTDAYDEALAVPTEAAALLALRQQQVIAEETGVAATVDPLGGSWFVEALTNETERAVWRYLDEIDRRGGMVAAITAGYPQREIADAAYRFQRELDAGERRIVGVNAYVDESEAADGPGPPGADRVAGAPARPTRAHAPRARRLGGDAGPSRRPWPACETPPAARRRATTNLMPHFIRCAAAYATLGEQCGVLREVFGEYREPVAV